jgi:hypothetical protein
MLILVSISSCLITVGQTLSKTAFAVTLLRITESWQRYALWVIIVSLNLYLAILLVLNWVNYCGQNEYWWKIPSVCAPYDTIFQIKIGQNSESPSRAHTLPRCCVQASALGTDRCCAQYSTSSSTLSCHCSRGSSRGS